MSTHKEEVVYLKRKTNRSRYDTRLIMAIVKEIESGVPRKSIEEKYGVSPDSLSKWLRDSGSELYKPIQKVYTTSEKRSVVRAIEGGMSLKEAKIAFNLCNTRVIRNWLRAFKEENPEIRVTNPINMPKNTTDTSAEIKALRKELSEANLKIKALDTLIDIAEEHLKIDIRKKPGAKQSKK